MVKEWDWRILSKRKEELYKRVVDDPENKKGNSMVGGKCFELP
jgi:hypothetical protein